MFEQRDLRIWSRGTPVIVIAVTIAAFAAISSMRAEAAGEPGKGRGLVAKLQNAGIGPKSN